MALVLQNDSHFETRSELEVLAAEAAREALKLRCQPFSSKHKPPKHKVFQEEILSKQIQPQERDAYSQ